MFSSTIRSKLSPYRCPSPVSSSSAEASSSTSVPGPSTSEGPSTSASDPGPSSSSLASTTDSKDEPLSGKMFRHVTWNIDGMQPKNLPLRMKAICEALVKDKVSIAFLQEVTFDCEEIIEELLKSKFHIFTGFNSTTEYFTLTLVSKGSFFKVIDHEVLEYENTFMGRNLLQVNVSCVTHSCACSLILRRIICHCIYH